MQQLFFIGFTAPFNGKKGPRDSRIACLRGTFLSGYTAFVTCRS